jgi:hypothetical protein
MMFPQIRCYHSNVMPQPHVFYILCKGENAGKPSLKPWANSFAVICSNQQYFDFYFWLVWGLFKSNKFKIHLRGTAVPFINLDDVRDVIREMAPAVFPDWSKFQELIITMDRLEKLKSNLAQQVIASENLQRQLIRRYFDEVTKKVPR